MRYAPNGCSARRVDENEINPLNYLCSPLQFHPGANAIHCTLTKALRFKSFQNTSDKPQRNGTPRAVAVTKYN